MISLTIHEATHSRQLNSATDSFYSLYHPKPQLSTAGTQLLKNFAATVSQQPTDAQKRELLAQILALEGNEHYDLGRISSWFQRHAPTKRDKGSERHAPTKRGKESETKVRLSQAGSKVLKYFFDNVSRFPTQSQRETLLAEVRALPDDSHYDIDRLTTWFVGQRQHHKDPTQPSAKRGRPRTRKEPQNSVSQVDAKLTAEGAQVLQTFLATVSQTPTDAQKHALVAQVCALPGNEHFTFDEITSWFNSDDPRPRQRGRRPTEVSQMLRLFFDTVSHYPSKSERETLVARIQALPGKENYTHDKLSMWFAAHRRKNGVSTRRRGRPRIQLSLTSQVEDDLAVFIRETPNPSDALLGVWARALGCDVGEMKAYIERKKAERMLTPEEDDEYSEEEEEEEDAEIPEQPTTLVSKPWIPFRLPTEHQPSTESQSESSAFRFKVWTPPARQSTPPCSSTADPDLNQISVSSLALEEMTEATPSGEVADLALSSLFDTAPFYTLSEAPTSGFEFLARFAPYEAKMKRIIAALNDQPV